MAEPPLEKEAAPSVQEMPQANVPQSFSKYEGKIQKLYQLKQVPGAKIQTGPGLPRWSWREVSVTWSGPVQKGQQLRFFLKRCKIFPSLEEERLVFVRSLLNIWIADLSLQDLHPDQFYRDMDHKDP